MQEHLPSRRELQPPGQHSFPCGNRQSKGAITPNHSPQVTNSPACQADRVLQEAGYNLLTHIKETTLRCLCCQRPNYGSNFLQIPEGERRRGRAPGHPHTPALPQVSCGTPRPPR